LRCPQCGNELPTNATTCEYCGAREQRTSRSSSCLLLLLAFIVWWIGVFVFASLIIGTGRVGLGVVFWVLGIFGSPVFVPLLLAKLLPDKTAWVRPG
jgi:hypothetical protein